MRRNSAALIATILLVSVVGCIDSERGPIAAERAGPGDCEAVYVASIVGPLTDPTRFNGECVFLHGYYSRGDLYLTRDYAEVFAVELSIPVSDPGDGRLESSSCDNSYVAIDARYEWTELNGAILFDVSRMWRPGRPADEPACWPLD